MTEHETFAAIARLRSAALEQAAGRPVRSTTLIQLGLDALLADVDSPSLRMLAGLGRREESEAQALFDAVVDELGLRAQIPDDQVAALWSLAREAAAAIVRGEVSPLEGADIIWREFIEPLDYPPALMPFFNAILAAYGPEADMPDLEQITTDILRAARELSAEPPTTA
jgi:hypothetical protein